MAAKTQELKAVEVEVPKQTRGGRRTSIPAEFVAECVAILDKGGAASDSIAYEATNGKNAEDNDRLSRIRANSQMAKVKKAILNAPDNQYENAAQLRSRTWKPEGSSGYVFALFLNENYTPDGEES